MGIIKYQGTMTLAKLSCNKVGIKWAATAILKDIYYFKIFSFTAIITERKIIVIAKSYVEVRYQTDRPQLLKNKKTP